MSELKLMKSKDKINLIFPNFKLWIHILVEPSFNTGNVLMLQRLTANDETEIGDMENIETNDIDAGDGESLQLICRIKSRPVAKITWYIGKILT